MLKNCNGFSVVEVLGSFSIFLIVIIMMIPILMIVYEERTALEFKREALRYLHNETESYLYDSTVEFGRREIEISKRKYVVTTDKVNDLIKICVRWEMPRLKKGFVCGYAKK